MKKPLRRYTIAAVRIFFIVITLSTFAVAEAQQERSRNPFQRLQQQIDTLNKCRQPVLVRFQVELVLTCLVSSDHSLLENGASWLVD
jgi:hypothetical protein